MISDSASRGVASDPRAARGGLRAAGPAGAGCDAEQIWHRAARLVICNCLLVMSAFLAVCLSLRYFFFAADKTLNQEMRHPAPMGHASSGQRKGVLELRIQPWTEGLRSAGSSWNRRDTRDALFTCGCPLPNLSHLLPAAFCTSFASLSLQ